MIENGSVDVKMLAKPLLGVQMGKDVTAGLRAYRDA
jgi:hypothetical protein